MLELSYTVVGNGTILWQSLADSNKMKHTDKIKYIFLLCLKTPNPGLLKRNYRTNSQGNSQVNFARMSVQNSPLLQCLSRANDVFIHRWIPDMLC